MKIVVGLRNPESQYTGTRHNVGAEVVEAVVSGQGERLRRGPRQVRCDTAQLTFGGGSVVAALPRLSMNVCGPAVAALLAYYKVDPADLLVVHDDLDLGFARLRVHHGRGHGGHNGVRSVVGALGTRDFWRLKVGIGRPPGRMDPATYVLRDFTRDQRPEIDLLVQDAAQVVAQFFDDPDRAVQMAGQRMAATLQPAPVGEVSG